MTKSLSTARSTSSSTALRAKGSEAASEAFSAPSVDASSPRKDLEKQQLQPQTYQWVKSVLSIKISEYPLWLLSFQEKYLEKPIWPINETSHLNWNVKTVSSFRYPLTLTSYQFMYYIRHVVHVVHPSSISFRDREKVRESLTTKTKSKFTM